MPWYLFENCAKYLHLKFGLHGAQASNNRSGIFGIKNNDAIGDKPIVWVWPHHFLAFPLR
jgi:hypothetical protein